MVMRVLVLGAQSAILRLVQVNLQRAGHEVYVASSGIRAAVLLAEHLPEVVLLDRKFPPPDFEHFEAARLQPRYSRVQVCDVADRRAIERLMRAR